LWGKRHRESLCVQKHAANSRLEMWTHAVHRRELGGDLRRSCATESRSTTCMVPPQRGHFGSELEGADGVAGGAVGGGVCWSSGKQSGRNFARRLFARKPKLRMRMKPFGKRWSRKRRRNSSTNRLVIRWQLPWAESLHRNVTLPSARASSRWLEMATRWV